MAHRWFLVLLILACCFPIPCVGETAPAETENSLGAPPRYAAIAQQVDQLLKERKFTEARAICEQQYAAATDDEARALFLRGQAEVLKVERSVKCIDVFKEVIARYPATTQAGWAKLGLAESYAWMGLIVGKPNEYFALALPLLDQFVKEHPTDSHCAKALWGMGLIYDRLKDVPAALAVYQKAATSYATQDMAPACLERVVALQQQLEQWDQALASARRYVQLYPGRKEAAAMQVAAGMCCVSKGDAAGAVAEFDRVLALFPANSAQCAQALLQKGLLYKSLGQPVTAREVFAQVIASYAGEHAAALAQQQLDQLAVQ